MISRGSLIDKSVMILTKQHNDKGELNRICKKLSISKGELGPFVKKREKERIEDQAQLFLASRQRKLNYIDG